MAWGILVPQSGIEPTTPPCPGAMESSPPGKPLRGWFRHTHSHMKTPAEIGHDAAPSQGNSKDCWNRLKKNFFFPLEPSMATCSSQYFEFALLASREKKKKKETYMVLSSCVIGYFVTAAAALGNRHTV